MTKRYYVVEHIFAVIHERENDDESAEEALDHAQFHYEENQCALDVASRLGYIADAVPGYCNMCSCRSAKVRSQHDTLEAARAGKDRPMLLNVRAYIDSMLAQGAITVDEAVREHLLQDIRENPEEKL